MLRIHICKPGFTLANTHLDGDGYAELGSRFKAANVKNMLWWLCRETQRVAEKLPDRPLQVLATLCWALQRTIELMDSTDLLFNDDDALEASRCLFLFLDCYQWLACDAWHKNLLFFNLRPKCHCLWHTAHSIRELKINPRVFQNFDEESFLGKIKLIACKCHGKTMTHRVYERYILVLALFVERMRRNSQFASSAV